MPTDTEAAALARPKPVGGYIFIRCYELLALWGCYRDGCLDHPDVRVAFALRELAKTRLHLSPGEHRRYQVTELVKLTNRKPACVRRSLHRLETLGLARVRKTEVAFSFGESFRETMMRPTVTRMIAATTNHRRKIRFRGGCSVG